ncbi:MAG: hypothetical protein WCL16_06080 [bacterium]
MSKELIPLERIETRILLLRGQKVMTDDGQFVRAVDFENLKAVLVASA